MAKYKNEVIQPILDGKDAEMNDLKKEVKLNSKKVKGLETKINKLTQSLNDLEQYGRRHNLRLNNVPLPDPSKCEETVLDILNKALPVLNEPFTPNDINRYHPIGKLNKKNNRQVIIRFSNYKAKAKAYDVRVQLVKGQHE